jgi:CheY-like chemotaxis protein
LPEQVIQADPARPREDEPEEDEGVERLGQLDELVEPAHARVRILVPVARVPTRILLVEDDADTREMLRLTLELAGHRVTPAGTGAEAIGLAAQVEPEILLIDLALPDIDGHEVARSVRAALGAGVVLIALTGFGGAEDLRRCRVAGFDAHVLKPATVEDRTAGLAQYGRRRHR